MTEQHVLKWISKLPQIRATDRPCLLWLLAWRAVLAILVYLSGLLRQLGKKHKFPYGSLGCVSRKHTHGPSPLPGLKSLEESNVFLRRSKNIFIKETIYQQKVSVHAQCLNI